MAATDGEERVIATAQHIVRTLGTNDNMTEDMLRILSNFDDRFSSMNEGLQMNREVNLSPVPLPINDIQNNLDYVEDTVMKWDMATSETARRLMIWECQPEESSSYLEAVDELQGMMEVLSVSRGGRSLLDRAHSIHQLAMARLEEEFKHILVVRSDPVDREWLLDCVSGASLHANFEEDGTDAASHSSGENERGEDIPVAQPVTDFNNIFDLIPAERIPHLNDIAKRMVTGGYGRECCQVYVSIRKAVLEQNLHRLGVEKLSIEDVQKMAWEILEGKIKRWIQSLRVSTKVLLASERKLSDQVFAGLSPWRETGFVELTKASMMQLLSFSEAVAVSRRSPEKLFRILDMYETLWDLIPDVNSVFSDEVCSTIRSEANGILMRLGEAALGTFTEFENAIQRDTSKTPVPGGAVHPLTRYVMNYIRFLFDYTDTLTHLLGERKKDVPRLMGTERNSLADLVGEEENSGADSLSPSAGQIVWLTVLLECNLDGKSKLYKDPAQTYLFLMNNVRYIVQKVKQSELATFLGEDWVKKHTGQVQQYATSYVRTAWKKVHACLREEGLTGSGSLPSSLSKVALKERFKSFNSAFEDVHRTQSTWVVPDPQLREELRILIAEKLIPAYRSFLFRFNNHVETGKHPEKYIKYSPEDLENHLMELFEVSSGSAAVRRKPLPTGSS